jgi:predicted O-linked N-acetylglucosamine transferase (SPINDLY family)
LRHDLGVDDGTVLLGSIGRAQKIDSNEFLLALAKILLSRPNTKFLWFGDSELASVRSRMKQAGISERCLFQGHVTVEIYAKVLDIHLDSFPFPTGLTMCDTLSAGRAFVWLDSDVTQANGVPPLVVPLVKGILGTPAEQDLARSIFTDPESAESLLPLARDAEHFVQLAVRMIDDPVYRAKVGQAGQNYMRNFLLDIRAPARVFSSHIQDVVSEVKARYAHDAAEENTGVR